MIYLNEGTWANDAPWDCSDWDGPGKTDEEMEELIQSMETLKANGVEAKLGYSDIVYAHVDVLETVVIEHETYHLFAMPHTEGLYVTKNNHLETNGKLSLTTYPGRDKTVILFEPLNTSYLTLNNVKLNGYGEELNQVLTLLQDRYSSYHKASESVVKLQHPSVKNPDWVAPVEEVEEADDTTAIFEGYEDLLDNIDIDSYTLF